MRSKTPINVYVEWEVRNPDGTFVVRPRRKRSHSFLRNFIAFLIYIWDHPYDDFGSSVTFVKTDGTTVSLRAGSDPAYRNCAVRAPLGTATYGLVVGTDGTPNTVDQHKLLAQCLEGTGASQFNHSTVSFSSYGVSDSTWNFVITRSFVNNSPSSITVREIGIYANHIGNIICLARDVITPTTVPKGSTLTVRYTISITVA